MALPAQAPLYFFQCHVARVIDEFLALVKRNDRVLHAFERAVLFQMLHHVAHREHGCLQRGVGVADDDVAHVAQRFL